jgi:hypothetical protein
MAHIYYYHQKGKLQPVQFFADATDTRSIVDTEGFPLKKSISLTDIVCSCGSRSCHRLSNSPILVSLIKRALTDARCDYGLKLANPKVELVKRGFLSELRVNLGNLGTEQ